MKNFLFIALFLCFISSNAFAQSSNPQVGDTFTIAKVENNNYNHIQFPRANIIIKKGGIANYNSLIGETVEITSIKENNKGQRIATIKLTSPRLFFKSHKYIKVAIDEAIDSKELVGK